MRYPLFDDSGNIAWAFEAVQALSCECYETLREQISVS
jgi:hypothetical protein